MSNLAQYIEQGDLIWARVVPPRGEPKRRPVVVITASDEIIMDQPIVATAVTTTFPNPTPCNMVALPWDPRGHRSTGLKRRSATVCDWLVSFHPSDVDEVAGRLPKKVLLEVVRKVKSLSDG